MNSQQMFTSQDQVDELQMRMLSQMPLTTSRVVESTVVKSSYSVMQANGSKVFGPSDEWIGPPPSSACELYIRRIPKNMNEQALLQPFLRFGKIYQFRVPIDFLNSLRGYGYVRYTNEDDAGCAMEVLNHYFIAPKTTLDIVNSCEKVRLFVSNIPKNLTEDEIEKEFRTIFPSMQGIYSKGSSRSSDGNMGYVFVNFATHNEALDAKKRTSPGVIRLWGQELKVVWANTEGSNLSSSNKTLFVRNVDLKLNNKDLVDLMLNYVHRTTIRKISKVRTNAFLDFTTREAAETVLQKMQGAIIHNSRLEIEWAKPSAEQSLHRLRNTDFDALLRLKCIANLWNIPVIIFGTFFEKVGIQYAAVLLRNAECKLRFIIVTLQCKELVDIHSRLCEVVYSLINKVGGFPDCNYVLFAQKDLAHLLGVVVAGQQMTFVASHRVSHEFSFDTMEIIDISWACAYLSQSSEENLLQVYKNSFMGHNVYTYLSDWYTGLRAFGTIMPKYRNKPALKYNLNDTQIVLALCYKVTGSNTSFSAREYTPYEIWRYDCGHSGLPYITLTLLPLSVTQSRFATDHVLSQIQFGGVSYYHPKQKVMSPPLWISGATYGECLRTVAHAPATSTQQLMPECSGVQSNIC